MSNPYSGPFADTLQQIDKGRFHAELTDALTEVVAQVMQIGRPTSTGYRLVEDVPAEAPA